MKSDEFEKRLRTHADSAKNNIMTPPFDIEREEFVMTKKFNIKRLVIVAAAIICVVGTTVFAAYSYYNYLSAKDVADALGDEKLSQYLGDGEAISETVTDGEYTATLLGIASGENLSDFKASSWEVFPERTYAVVAVEKTDGSPMTWDDNNTICVTPLIEGLTPWEYNVVTMNGSYTADIIDGVLYRIVEFDSIEYFADRTVYMAVLSETFYQKDAYNYDEQTGLISVREEYDGTNILFELKLDKSKADPEKAEEYLKKFNEYIKAESSEDIVLEDENAEVKEIIIEPELNATTEEAFIVRSE